ncbi:hypothetical protein U7118_17705 [Bacillus subtilis]|nr:hypothetical protein [Bacillus subtilis]KIN32013.1 hypothetical protein B4068_0880 [Bacillus subtilis]KIN46170.1 hypothetical protein B4073_0869 [Bacillus subtilis]MEC0449444.1 hypothetical protein [Bacillus subtilis]MEC0455510.1 hypothetical protein [Bacillus subtilis]MED4518081.1 hypothetical protein [Bacillus subtilis]
MLFKQKTIGQLIGPPKALISTRTEMGAFLFFLKAGLAEREG